MRLDVHGFRIAVTGEWDGVVDDLGRDFAWFRGGPDARPALTLAVSRGAPDYDRFGPLRAAFVTPRNVVYQGERATVVDYFGRAATVVDRVTGDAAIEGEDRALVHEAAYQLLLSRIGEHLDRRRLVRLHALGLSGPTGAVAVMLPSGGGKSTLCLQALRDPAARLLSEDSPVLDGHGRLHAFPLRIAVNATDAHLLPVGAVRQLDRMEFHPKLALDIERFADRIDREPRPLRHLVLGIRTLGRDARLVEVGRAAAFSALLREAVIGVGIYQGMEFVLQRGMRDVARKSGTAAMRARVAATALARARVWRLELGRDHARNWAALRPLLD